MMVTATSSLTTVFGGNQPTFVVDRSETAAFLHSQGMHAIDLATARVEPPENVVFILQDSHPSDPEYAGLEKALARSRMLSVPLLAFDNRQPATEYTLQALLRSDFVQAAERGRRWRQLFQRMPSPLIFADPARPEAQLRCHLPGDLKASTSEDLAIPLGEQRPLGWYFEFETEMLDRDRTRVFSIEGSLPVTGMLAARHHTMPRELHPLHAEATELVARYARSASRSVLQVRDNRVEQFLVDGEDWTPTLFRLSGEKHDFNILEFAIGTNSLSDVDWSINSCLNEGVQGVHIAVGDGQTGTHLDFVAPGMQLVA